MELIDDEGKLLGVVNVVDAVVVLGVLVLAVALAALLAGGSGDTADGATGYAVVEYTASVDVDGALVESNDTLTPVAGGDTFTVSDTHYSNALGGNAHVVALVSYTGTPTVSGEDVTAGERYRLSTGSYTTEVAVRDGNATSERLETASVPVVLAINESRSVSQAVEPGAVATVGGRTVATVESVTPVPDGPESRAELVGVELQALAGERTNWFGGRAVRANEQLTVVTDDAVVTGRVFQVGTTATEPLAEDQ